MVENQGIKLFYTKIRELLVSKGYEHTDWTKLHEEVVVTIKDSDPEGHLGHDGAPLRKNSHTILIEYEFNYPGRILFKDEKAQVALICQTCFPGSTVIYKQMAGASVRSGSSGKSPNRRKSTPDISGVPDKATPETLFAEPSHTEAEKVPNLHPMLEETPPVGLRPEFSFENFVCGSSNREAYLACERTCERPGDNFNPLMIYGPTGVGKTHLLMAVGNKLHRKHPDWNILCIAATDFVTEYQNALRKTNNPTIMREFTEKYLKCDALLVDDIQQLSNKDATQMEFFAVFNRLTNAKKQIVLTSDQLPKDIPKIEERLKSRFMQGLLVDIEPPGFEDRLAIIEAQAAVLKLKISKTAMLEIANRINTNVREIKGALNTLFMAQELRARPLTDDDVMEAVRKHTRVEPKQLDFLTIQRVVSTHYNVKVEDMLSKSRVANIAEARQVAMFLSKEILKETFATIGDKFGKKDHTTVMHSISKIQKLMEGDTSYKASINALRRKIEQNVG